MSSSRTALEGPGSSKAVTRKKILRASRVEATCSLNAVSMKPKSGLAEAQGESARTVEVLGLVDIGKEESSDLKQSEDPKRAVIKQVQKGTTHLQENS